MTFRIGFIPGDGIGPEVVAEARKALDASGVAYDAVDFDLGADRYLRTGDVLPEEDLSALRDVDAILLGAVGDPRVPPGVLERGLLLRLRFELDLYVNLRPVRLYPGVTSVLSGVDPADIDFVVVRENTEGLYAGAGGAHRPGTAQEVAIEESINTRAGVDRILEYAFETASRRTRRRLTMVHKTNVLVHAGGLWSRALAEMAADYPGVETDTVHVDAACLYLVSDPGRFDVVVTDNLFGDIITDLAAGIAGGIGLAASGNIYPARRGLFEPVHGSAPDLAGTGRANPIACILSAGMLLDHLGESDAARRVEDAAVGTLGKLGATAGPGMGFSTQEIGDMVAEAIQGG